MRDFRDAKAMAQTIRAALAAKGQKITIAESLELTAKAFGAADWNTLAAAIKSAESEKPDGPRVGPPPPDNTAALDRVAAALGWTDWDALVDALRTVSRDQPGRRARRPPVPLGQLPGNLAMDRLALALGWTDWEALEAALRTVKPDQPGRRAPDEGVAPTAPIRTGASFSSALQATLNRSVAFAAERKHGYNTLEHLLLALIDDPDAAAVMEACSAELPALRAAVTRYLDAELKQLTTLGEPSDEPPPTAGFHRVVTRSVIHVQSAGRHEVTGANLLVAIFSERESHACAFLQTAGLNRYDCVAFIAHGVRPLPRGRGRGAAGGGRRR